MSVPGPITADAVFLNKEEVSVVPIYRDPIHDFGFFRFDPNELKWVQASTAMSSHMCTASSSFEGFGFCSPTPRSHSMNKLYRSTGCSYNIGLGR